MRISSRIKTAVVVVATLVTGFGIAIIRRSSDPILLSSGEFHSAAHRGKGEVRIVALPDGSRWLRMIGIRTYPSRDLRLILISAADANENETVARSEKYDAGPLASDEGDLDIELPADLDLSRFNAVTIWNSAYKVNYATAPLKRHKENVP